MSKKYDKESPTIACIMMVKNETFSIKKTLDTLVGKVDGVIVYDTGSTDDTLDIIRKFSETTGMKTHIKEGEFVDFSTSRNVLLDYAETLKSEYDYLFLMDSNDELRDEGEGKTLRDFVNSRYKLLKDDESLDSKQIHQAYLLNQNWWNGVVTSYWNARLILNGFGWRFTGKVHEYISTTVGIREMLEKVPNVIIYQDRINDDNKSKIRFNRDAKILQQCVEEDPDDSRSVYYLAQTYSCLNDYENAYKYYLMRSTMGGFHEEVYNAMFNCGKLNYDMGKDLNTTMGHFIEAFEKFKRAEPVAFLAEIFRLRKQYELSYHFAMLACSIPYPVNTILFVDKRCYDYMRWHTLGIVAYYTGNYRVGADACRRCIAHGEDVKLNESNLKFYTEKLEEIERNRK